MPPQLHRSWYFGVPATAYVIYWRSCHVGLVVVRLLSSWPEHMKETQTQHPSGGEMIRRMVGYSTIDPILNMMLPPIQSCGLVGAFVTLTECNDSFFFDDM